MNREELLEKLAKHGKIDPDPIFVLVISDIKQPKLFKSRELALEVAEDMAERRELREAHVGHAAQEEGLIAQWIPKTGDRWPRLWVYDTRANLTWKTREVVVDEPDV